MTNSGGHFSRRRHRKLVGGLVMFLIAIVFLFPFFVVIINSFRTQAEFLSRMIGMPSSLNFENYRFIFQEVNYLLVYQNSILILVISMVGIVLVSSLAASKVARKTGKFNSLIYFLMILTMVIPFQARMLPLMSVVGTLQLSNSLFGMSLLHVATLSPPVFFMYTGAMRSIPYELEEAARIDGAGSILTYWHIILPLLKPMTMTVCVLFGLVVWNSFLLPMLVLTNSSMHTIPLVIFRFYGTYQVMWPALFANIVIGSAPIFLIFLLLQRYVVSGITAGSVKG
jgi:raffinose/stachyose/melibiose transport system permease protein